MFADDCLVCREIRDEHNTRILQADLDSLQRWEQDWSVQFNPSRCEAITITKKTKPVKEEYKLHNEVLTTVLSAKYLGVHLNNKLSWNDHIKITTKKASQILNFLRKNFWLLQATFVSSSTRHWCDHSLSMLCLYGITRWNEISTRLRQFSGAQYLLALEDLKLSTCRSSAILIPYLQSILLSSHNQSVEHSAVDVCQLSPDSFEAHLSAIQFV